MMEQNEWNLPGETLIWDRTQEQERGEVLVPFARDELLCRSVGNGAPPIVHIWRHPRAFVMGLRDGRLPHALRAARQLEEQGYSVAIRNSGGAAVPLDPGVINISLIMPKRQGQIDFRHDFETMYRFIGEALRNLTPDVAKGEIKGSYCPGDYDLSIGGRKFCGIAQRRQAHAFAVQAFVVVKGSGKERAALTREFYGIAANGAEGPCFPKVKEESMASLEELIGISDERQFVDAVKDVVRARKQAAEVEQAALHLPSEGEIAAMVDTLKSRYGLAESL